MTLWCQESVVSNHEVHQVKIFSHVIPRIFLAFFLPPLLVYTMDHKSFQSQPRRKESVDQFPCFRFG